jgi:hypothetical protein
MIIYEEMIMYEGRCQGRLSKENVLIAWISGGGRRCARQVLNIPSTWSHQREVYLVLPLVYDETTDLLAICS